MTTNTLPAKVKARALNRLRQFMPSHDQRFEPKQLDYLDQYLRNPLEALRHEAAVSVEVHADGRCSIDGKLLPKEGLGLTLSWFGLCAHQTQQPPPHADWIYLNHKSPGTGILPRTAWTQPDSPMNTKSRGKYARWV